MENIENLKALGESLGYEGHGLRVFLKDQQNRLHDDKLREKEQLEHELLLKARNKDGQVKHVKWKFSAKGKCAKLKLNKKSTKEKCVKSNLSPKGSAQKSARRR